jgi:hypothetical protein
VSHRAQVPIITNRLQFQRLKKKEENTLPIPISAGTLPTPGSLMKENLQMLVRKMNGLQHSKIDILGRMRRSLLLKFKKTDKMLDGIPQPLIKEMRNKTQLMELIMNGPNGMSHLHLNHSQLLTSKERMLVGTLQAPESSTRKPFQVMLLTMRGPHLSLELNKMKMVMTIKRSLLPKLKMVKMKDKRMMVLMIKASVNSKMEIMLSKTFKIIKKDQFHQLRPEKKKNKQKKWMKMLKLNPKMVMLLKKNKKTKLKRRLAS